MLYKNIIYISVAVLTCLRYGTMHGMLELPNYLRQHNSSQYEDADEQYTRITHEALTHMGVKDPNKVPIKKYNSLCTFFDSGVDGSTNGKIIWLKHPQPGQNETDIIASTNPKDGIKAVRAAADTFICYHEAAHYKLKHNLKSILMHDTIVIATTLAGNPFVVSKALKYTGLRDSRFVILVGLASATLLIHLSDMIARYIDSIYSKKQEKEADLYAAQILKSTGQGHMLKKHIDIDKKSDFELFNNAFFVKKIEDSIEKIYHSSSKQGPLKVDMDNNSIHFHDEINMIAIQPSDFEAFKKELHKRLVEKLSSFLEKQRTPWWSTRTHYLPNERRKYLQKFLTA